MKDNKTFFSILIALLFVFMFPLTASANSSWHWISSKRPLDLLPVVIIVTLIIEIVSVYYIAKVKDLKRVIPTVLLANLVSFLAPYIWMAVDPYNIYSFYTFEEGIFYSIDRNVNSSPTFTVSILYLLITLLIEVPIVFLILRKKAPNKIVLIATIVGSNVITTAITFAVERIFCYGQW